MLYDSKLEKDNCGFGLIAQVNGQASHRLIRTAITGLDRMEHRGGISADGKTGDGCGLLMQKPDSFFRAIASEHDWHLGKNYAVGMVFLNADPVLAQTAKDVLSEELEKETLSIQGWRVVPTDASCLGPIAKKQLPGFEQIFVSAPEGWRPKDLERRLYVARRRAEKRLENDEHFYIASLSGLVTVYKGLMMPVDLPNFYLDLADIRMTSAICAPQLDWHFPSKREL